MYHEANYVGSCLFVFISFMCISVIVTVRPLELPLELRVWNHWLQELYLLSLSLRTPWRHKGVQGKCTSFHAFAALVVSSWLGGLQSWSGHFEEDKNLLGLWGTEPRTIQFVH